uniref:Ribophorin II n=1 Tax=Albugo laibachii Nc14 TaxID=890382 RepID=F0W4Q7_9STRA|nr:conserved hypothetical protein [Albugo laibachii Nc14]|eukprot:CCA16092.1 conserved hypothetical protein [Albugo laibachii Nc14]
MQSVCLIALIAFYGVSANSEKLGLFSLKSNALVLSKTAPLQLVIQVTQGQESINELVVKSIKNTVSGAVVLSDKTVTGNGKEFALKLDNAVSAGIYETVVRNSEADQEESVLFKVLTPVSIQSANFNGVTLTEGQQLARESFSSGSQDVFEAEIVVEDSLKHEPIRPQQAVLHFTHQMHKNDVYFALESSKTQPANLKVSLQFASLSKTFQYHSGSYNVRVILADVSFQKPIVWDLGTLEVLLATAAPSATSRLYAKPLLHESDTTFKALPEIVHIMRTQEPRPPVIVSLLFSGAVLLPLIGFAGFVVGSRYNAKKLFKSHIFAYGVVFLASLVAIMGLYALFWVRLTFFHLLGYLSFVGSVFVISGHATLKRLAELQVKKL